MILLHKKKYPDYWGAIEIQLGHPVSEQDIFSSLDGSYDSLYAGFLGNQTLWLIKRTSAGIFAKTSNGVVSGFITAGDHKDLNRLIIVFSTLFEK